ncbi:MAG: Gfo/Idh/MocA family oxidoreductase [Planctomycetaceae bacterium]|jgi:predicted dehydrogenase|nr:Gfo/Idh/MocA family oxidoreductase [Planctomycetaceae bacterium]MBT6157122.1 Gfo/Idh/MocA family oxidoreductase [Planctomycetaceae bacterium]MBT6483651.1 Gfo/Idh/MocA family oxidoreductase [Planctomycetaceae bacterium]MBT6497074.1 Gfo/Idh/MocA family oxidoreductase [Planctomycetaceae bacterium]
MSDVRSRREFLQAAVAAGTTIPAGLSLLAPARVRAEKRSANEKLNLGIIGVAARGGANLNGVSGENIVVLCDIDSKRLGQAAERFPKAKTYADYRRVFDHKNLDGVVVSTPDHMHAIPVVQALRQGLAVYCEKPLAHSVHEIRTIREETAKAKVVTQMGTQIHAGNNYRRVVETIQAGTIGPVKRVHVWLGSGVRTGQRVKQGTPPAHVDYDLWLGPAPYRPFHTSHFHFNWRYWWDFGGGQLADFWCHYVDLVFWALKLKAPTTVAAQGEKGHDGDNECPNQMRIDYIFPAMGKQPPVHLTWYQGGWKPKGAEVYGKGSAVLFEGDDGRLLADYGSKKLFMEGGQQPDPIEQTIPNSIGHHKEWIEAVKGNGKTTCHFEYGGALAEAGLLGNVSYRAGKKKLEWDAEKLKATNCPEADQYIRREYRKGWVL